jgi:hypothetical protein
MTKPVKHEKIPTGVTCLVCQGPAGTDDKGACVGRGFICPKCGCWRLPRKPATK